jgi:formylglycine-generating enzyme required for sulfatase activity
MGAQATDTAGPGYDPDATPEEGPPRRVTVGALTAHVREVDARSYRLCVQAGACRLGDVLAEGGYFNYGQSERGEYPMNGVSWVGAQRFCRWMGGRLPTEAEWEYLARGAEGRRFPWGDHAPRCRVGANARIPQGCPTDGTGPPGLAQTRSAMGLAGMGDGVWEWVADWYGPYAPSVTVRPTGPATGVERVHRGGGWTTEVSTERRASFRAALPPDTRLSDVGFRCVRDAE